MASLHPYLLLGGLWATVYTTYRLFTYREVIVWVKEKHIFSRNHRLPQYAFLTSDHTMYRVPYSLLSFQFHPRALWAPIQPGSVYQIRCWGVDLPLLGLSPCVDRVSLLTEGTDSDAIRVGEVEAIQLMRGETMKL